MVRIRLKRTGTRNALCFRVVVMDDRSSRDGKAIEELGYYDPRGKNEKINLERYNYWVGVGGSASETVAAIADRQAKGVSLKDKVRQPSLSKKAKAKIEAEAKAKADAAAAEAKAKADAAAAEAKAKADAAAAEAKAKADAEAAAAAAAAAPAEGEAQA